ncbi:MAG: exodeoxyribonuclease III [Myxococcota bacterium]
MRVATWNINGLRARLDFLRLWLRDRRPDVVGLQELKLEDEKFPHAEIEAEGYRAVTHGQKSWNGVAILARDDAEVTQRGLPGQQDLGARLISANVSGLSFTTVYCPNGKHVGHDDFPRKLAWFETLADHAAPAARAEAPAILCGDFNVCPTALDSWDGKRFAGEIFHTEEERRCYGDVLAGGYTDAWRAAHPDTPAFSWWDYRGGAFHRKQGLRIDFVLANPAALARIRSVEIDREYRKKKEGLTASDHAPVFADLE